MPWPSYLSGCGGYSPSARLSQTVFIVYGSVQNQKKKNKQNCAGIVSKWLGFSEVIIVGTTGG